jgi:hypothetical protein
LRLCAFARNFSEVKSIRMALRLCAFARNFSEVKSIRMALRLCAFARNFSVAQPLKSYYYKFKTKHDEELNNSSYF